MKSAPCSASRNSVPVPARHEAPSGRFPSISLLQRSPHVQEIVEEARKANQVTFQRSISAASRSLQSPVTETSDFGTPYLDGKRVNLSVVSPPPVNSVRRRGSSSASNAARSSVGERGCRADYEELCRKCFICSEQNGDCVKPRETGARQNKSTRSSFLAGVKARVKNSRRMKAWSVDLNGAEDAAVEVLSIVLLNRRKIAAIRISLPYCACKVFNGV